MSLRHGFRVFAFDSPPNWFFEPCATGSPCTWNCISRSGIALPFELVPEGSSGLGEEYGVGVVALPELLALRGALLVGHRPPPLRQLFTSPFHLRPAIRLIVESFIPEAIRISSQVAPEERAPRIAVVATPSSSRAVSLAS